MLAMFRNLNPRKPQNLGRSWGCVNHIQQAIRIFLLQRLRTPSFIVGLPPSFAATNQFPGIPTTISFLSVSQSVSSLHLQFVPINIQQSTHTLIQLHLFIPQFSASTNPHSSSLFVICLLANLCYRLHITQYWGKAWLITCTSRRNPEGASSIPPHYVFCCSLSWCVAFVRRETQTHPTHSRGSACRACTDSVVMPKTCLLPCTSRISRGRGRHPTIRTDWI
jgi:hypothetical protein